MKKIPLVLIFPLLFCGVIKWTSGRVLIVPHEILKVCTSEVTKTSNNFEVNDYTNFKVHLENDTHTFLNGSVTFNIDVEKISGRAYMEHYDRGQWTIRVMDRYIKDMCKAMHDPLQPTFPYTHEFPHCPYKKGTILKFDMIPFTFPEPLLEGAPHHYLGPWRMTGIYEFTIPNGTVIVTCLRGYADVHDDPRPRNLTRLVNPLSG